MHELSSFQKSQAERLAKPRYNRRRRHSVDRIALEEVKEIPTPSNKQSLMSVMRMTMNNSKGPKSVLRYQQQHKHSTLFSSQLRPEAEYEEMMVD